MILGNEPLVVICVLWKNDNKVISWCQNHCVLDYNCHIYIIRRYNEVLILVLLQI